MKKLATILVAMFASVGLIVAAAQGEEREVPNPEGEEREVLNPDPAISLQAEVARYTSLKERLDQQQVQDFYKDVAHAYELVAYMEALKDEREAKERADAERAAAAAARVASSKAQRVGTSERSQGGGGDTGGRHFMCPQFASSDNPTGDFAIPCERIDNESDGNYQADNPNSSAYGAYQILHLPPGTPPAEQDRIARGMALCNWSPETNYCAGG